MPGCKPAGGVVAAYQCMLLGVVGVGIGDMRRNIYPVDGDTAADGQVTQQAAAAVCQQRIRVLRTDQTAAVVGRVQIMRRGRIRPRAAAGG